MKMGKKVREYKAGDFIFAKVKGYPAWPARVQRPNGKKYFVYFYGTGETANLPPNMIFDYAENKDKFLSKAVKRRDFNDGVKQIEHDFANNVPLEQVIGVAMEVPEESANDTVNDSAINDTIDDTAVDTTAAEDTTVADESAVNTPAENEPMVEDSDETGALVIDEGKKGRKSTAKPLPATPKTMKEPKTPRGKKKEEAEENKEEEKKDDEIVSRSGRKIRPKRYIDEQTEENSTLPSPAPKKRRGASPPVDKEEKTDKTDAKNKSEKIDKTDKSGKQLNTVTQAELEDLKEPFTSDSESQCNIIIQDSKSRSCIQNNQISVIKNVSEMNDISETIRKITNDAPRAKAVAKSKKFIPPLKTMPESVEKNSNKYIDKSHYNSNNDHGNVDENSSRHLIGKNCKDYNKVVQLLSACEIDANSKSSCNFNQQVKLFKTTAKHYISESNYIIYDHLNNSDFDTYRESIIDEFRTQNKVDNVVDFTYSNNLDSKEHHQECPELDKDTFSLHGMIFQSVNLLNENDLFTQNLSGLSCHSINVTQDSRCNSITSVVTLNKTYKDLDLKSFENCNLGIMSRIPEMNNNVDSDNDMNNNTGDISHVIPKGDDFLNLFANNNLIMDNNNFVAMSTEFGDMGFNIKYSEYIKQFGNVTDDFNKLEDHTNKILTMYPNDNTILFNKFINSK